MVNNMNVSFIKAFSDNYIWAITNENSHYLALVDPGQADVCITYIEENQLQLTSILITHHHKDHVGGIATLVDYCKAKQWPLTVYGPSAEQIENCDITVSETDTVILDTLAIEFTVIDLPGHTLGHIAYLAQDNLFCGDTLFSGGCGRIFEGTPQQMFDSLAKLKALPDRTRVYCAHEYTLANLNFALAVEPQNFEVIHYYNQVVQAREKQQATIPTSISLEKKINPFLRCDQQSLIDSAIEYSDMQISEPLTAFTVIRGWKDNF